MKLKLTHSGKDLLLRTIAGETTINFTAIQLGNGADAGESAAELSNPLLTAEVASYEIGDVFITLSSVFSNSEVTAGFRATELGVLADDPDKEGRTLLYAYGYTPDAEADYIPASDDKLLETQQDVMVYIGDAQNVTASISQSLVYAAKADLEAHIKDYGNPHRVDKEAVGLGNVPNVATNDQTPTYAEASALSKLLSGEKLSVAFGKIARAVSSLISHIDTVGKNVHKETADSIGAAAKVHKHSTADITSGVLGLARGGIGVTSYDALGEKLGIPAIKKSVDDSYRKDQVLADDARTLLGLSKEAIPNDAFLKLGQNNKYWWKRRTVSVSYIEDTSGAVSALEIVHKSSSTDPETIQYSNGINIDQATGKVTLAAPVSELSLTYNGHDDALILRGKYFVSAYAQSVNYADADADVTYENGTVYSVSIQRREVNSIQKVTLSEWEFLQSTNRNAYPDSGVVDGVEYQFCGIPSENAVDPVRIMTGFYIGNGLYGADNPNRLTFSYPPKILFVQRANNEKSNATNGRITAIRGVTGTDVDNFLNYPVVKMAWEENTVEWYNKDDAQYQLNSVNEKYLWVALY